MSDSKPKQEQLKIEVASTRVEKPKKSKEDGAAILSCSCASPFQDARYGRGRRVFACAAKKRTCTVCGRNQ